MTKITLLPKKVNNKGVIHLALPFVFLLVLAGGLFILVSLKIIKLPSLPFLQKTPSVDLKTEYENPFKKETQYVNPFETYKNPFTIAK